MDTCNIKFEATAFRRDDDNNLESLSASITVPVESDDEVIGNMLGNQDLIVHTIGALCQLVSYVYPEWMDDEDTGLTLDTYLDGRKCQTHRGLVAMTPESFSYDLED